MVGEVEQVEERLAGKRSGAKVVDWFIVAGRTREGI